MPLLSHGEILTVKDHARVDLTTHSNCVVLEDHEVADFRGIPGRFRALISNLNNLTLLSPVRRHLNASTRVKYRGRALLNYSALN